MSKARFHAIDGLRAVAAILVLIHHLMGTGLGSGAFARAASSLTASGVELFFVLSAVVLGRRYIREGRAMDLRTYANRRIERLWPPYVVAWLLAGVAVATTSHWPTWWTRGAALPSFDTADWIAQVFIVNAWVREYNFAWWSLTVEVLFYVALPLLLPVFRRVHGHAAGGVAIYAAAVAGSALGHGHVQPHLAGLFASYAACFVGGLILATFDLPKSLRRVAMGVGVGWIVLAIGWTSVNPHVGWAMFYLGLVASSVDEGSRPQRWLSGPNLVWLGERSYSLFLVHYSVIALVCWAASELVQVKGVLYFGSTRALSVIGSVLMAMLVFHFIERRFATGLVTADQFWPPVFSRRAAKNTVLLQPMP